MAPSLDQKQRDSLRVTHRLLQEPIARGIHVSRRRAARHRAHVRWSRRRTRSGDEWPEKCGRSSCLSSALAVISLASAELHHSFTRMDGTWNSRRSPVYARHGMAASAQVGPFPRSGSVLHLSPPMFCSATARCLLIVSRCSGTSLCYALDGTICR